MLNNNILDDLRDRAILSPRRRAHLNIHNSYDSIIQKVISYVCTDSYIPPHYHYLDYQLETFVVLNGEFVLYTFDDTGIITSRTVLNNKNPIYEVNTHTIHTVVANSVDSILLEIKQGPFFAETSKAFPLWSVLENDDRANDGFEWLKQAQVGDVWCI
ncbi:WbuC family cupin fold metalloprotein [Limnobaculum zhutongyuii]|nr:WbuC family cupin fold metalloprotein [Limnobaculum zhutongyuii]